MHTFSSFLRQTLFVVAFFSGLQLAAQNIPAKTLAKRPHLILKTPYNVQLQEKVKEIQRKNNALLKLPQRQIAPEAFRNMNDASAFVNLYNQANRFIDTRLLPELFRTYLRTTPLSGGMPPVTDRVLSTLFNEQEQSCVAAEKTFSGVTNKKAAVEKDVLSAWDIETIRAGVYKISTASPKKYLTVKRSGQAGAYQVLLTVDKNDASSNWAIYYSPENGITFFNLASNVFLSKRIQGNKIFLATVGFRDFAAEKAKGLNSISWDLFYYERSREIPLPCGDPQYMHSMLYKLTKPLDRDIDGDGSENDLCGGDDCDDYDPSRYPGAPEVCDPEGRNEDCNDATFGMQDNDRDGYYSASCFNINFFTGAITSAGTDCDDSNPAIFPGQMIFIDDKHVDVCGEGLYEVEEGFMAVRQPNGTSIVVPRR